MMWADLIVLVDLTGDKIYVNAWLASFVAFVIAVLVWDKVRRP